MGTRQGSLENAMRSLNGLRFLVGVAVLGPQNEGNGEWQRQPYGLLAGMEMLFPGEDVACE